MDQKETKERPPLQQQQPRHTVWMFPKWPPDGVKRELDPRIEQQQKQQIQL